MLAGSSLGLVFNPRKPAVANPGNIKSPIIGLELVESGAEVQNIIGRADTEQGKEYRQRFNRGFYADYLLILGFVVFQISLGLLLHLNENLSKTGLYILTGLALSSGVFDVLEDLTVKQILAAAAADYLKIIPTLQSYTYIKWQTLGLCSLILAMGLGAAGKRLVPILFLASFVLAVLGMIMREAIEWQSYALILAWLLAYIKSLPYFQSTWWPAQSSA